VFKQQFSGPVGSLVGDMRLGALQTGSFRQDFAGGAVARLDGSLYFREDESGLVPYIAEVNGIVVLVGRDGARKAVLVPATAGGTFGFGPEAAADLADIARGVPDRHLPAGARLMPLCPPLAR
jgi:hypothetical protein